MNKTEISHEMTTEEYERMAQSIRSLDAELGFAINLTNEQRKRFNHMGDKSVAFVEKTLDYSQNRPDMVPPCSDIAIFRRDYELASKLRTLVEMAQPVIQKMIDSYQLVSANTFSSALKFYKYIQAAVASGVPGSTTISLDLGKRFARAKAADKPEEPVVPTKQ